VGIRFVALFALILTWATAARADAPVPFTPTLPNGVAVGHAEMAGRPTGCTVVLFAEDAVAGVDVRGGGPGSREIALLDPTNPTRKIQAIALSGGSAYGLGVATGVQLWLRERGRGFPTPAGPVALVPQSILFDLPVGDAAIVPDADCGRRAVAAAARQPAGPWAEGSVGAGAGATVGKMLGLGPADSMKSGLGIAGLTLPSGLTIGAVVAVNALGDVIDPANGRLVAGALKDGALVDTRDLIRSGAIWNEARGAGQNTTIGVVATNAQLTTADATKLAQMAQVGLGRTIVPVGTPYDGDTVYAAATGGWDGMVDMAVLGELGAQVMAEAILRAVCRAEPALGWTTATAMGRCSR
jgi:L-aminopeptidase/D-esterase-like protein